VVENVFKADRLLYHSTLGLRVIKKKKKKNIEAIQHSNAALHNGAPSE